MAIGLGAVVAVGLLKYLTGIVGWVVTLGKALGITGKATAKFSAEVGNLNKTGGLKTFAKQTATASGEAAGLSKTLGGLLEKMKGVAKGTGVLTALFGAIGIIGEVAAVVKRGDEAFRGLRNTLIEVERDTEDGLFKDLHEQSREQLGTIQEDLEKRLTEIRQALDAGREANKEIVFTPGVELISDESMDELYAKMLEYEQRLRETVLLVNAVDMGPKFKPETLVTLDKTTVSITKLSTSLSLLANSKADSTIARLNAVAATSAALLQAQGASAAELEALETQRVERVLEQEKYRAEQLLAIRAQETSDKLALMRNGESQEQKVLAQRRDLVAKLAEDRVKITADSLAKVKAALANSLRDEQQHAQALKGLQDSVGNIRQRHAQALQDLERSGMNEVEQQASRRQQLLAMTAQAEKALAEGRFKDAAKLADEIEKQTLAQGKASLQEASQDKSSLTRAIARSAEARKLKAAQALSLRIAEAAGSAEQEALSAIRERNAELGKSAGLYEAQLEVLQGEVVEIHTEIDANQVKEQVDRAFSEANKDPLKLDVKLNDEVVKRALKELTKPLKTTLEVVVKTTGSTDILRNAKGGPVPGIPGFAGGGDVRGPGTSTSDSILSWLSSGEFVINAKSVAMAMRLFGKDYLHNLNAGRFDRLKMPRFATGGPVGRVSSSSSKPGGGGSRVTLDLMINGQGQGALEGSSDTVGSLIDALHHLQR
jgi:hypothetical protein